MNIVKHFLLFFFLFLLTSLNAQEEKKKLYNPLSNAENDIAALLAQAQKENKHVVLQIGGNWCGWCIRFHDFVTQDSSINKIIKKDYLYYHLNYSKENTNDAILAKYQFPQRFGFPVLVILDAKGNRIHTQDSVHLELDKSYDAKKVKHFFASWTPSAVDPATYEKKE